MARKTTTSTEVKNRWKKANYKQIAVNLRYDEDKALLEWLEKNKDKYGVTNIFRAGIEALMKQEK